MGCGVWRRDGARVKKRESEGKTLLASSESVDETAKRGGHRQKRSEREGERETATQQEHDLLRREARDQKVLHCSHDVDFFPSLSSLEGKGKKASSKSGRQEHEGRKRKYVIRIMEGESERVKVEEREGEESGTDRETWTGV